MPLEKVPAFLKARSRSKKSDNNRFRVPIHFATNRFTSEKFSPPPPLFYPVRLLVAVRVPGLGQIAWRIVLTKKLRGHWHSAKKNRK